jgi:hypothetical protein
MLKRFLTVYTVALIKIAVKKIKTLLHSLHNIFTEVKVGFTAISG